MKIIRYLLFIPMCFLAIGIVYWGFAYLLAWFLGLNLSTLWLIIILLFFGGLIWGLFKRLSSVLMLLVSKVSPNPRFSFLTVLILSGFNGIIAIVNAWMMDINYSGKIVFGAIVYTILVIQLTHALIYGSAYEATDEY